MIENRYKKVGQVFAIVVVLSMILSAGAFLTFSTPISGVSQSETIEAAPGSTIKLKHSTFDPMVITPNLPSALSAPNYAPVVNAPYIIQAEGKITEEWKQDLMASGIEIVNYIPDNALLVRMDESTKLKADAISGIRWSGAYAPAYKISPRLSGLTGTVVIDISLFDSGHNGDVVKIITKSAGGKIISYVNNPNHKSVRAEVDASWIPQLAQLADVKWIDDFDQPRPMNDSTVPLLQGGASRPIHNALPNPGIEGLDEVITVMDSGITAAHDAFTGSIYTSSGNQPKLLANYIPASTPPNVQLGDYGPSYHGSHVSGTTAGDETYGTWEGTGTVGGPNDGHAFMAQIVLQDAGDSAQATAIFPANDMYNDAFLDSEVTYGSKIHTNSWGGGSGYGGDSAVIDQYIWDSQDYTILFAGGNDGFAEPPGRQAEAKNEITVGGTNNGGGGMYGSSTRGPTEDGRLYPDVLAPAVSIMSVNGATASNYKTLTGTSMATPAVAGTAAMVRQYYREGWYPTGAPVAANGWSPSAALIKASLVNGAVDILGTRPDNNQGWGRVHLDNSLYFAGDAREMFVIDQSQGMVTGDFIEYVFGVTNNAEEFRASLVWTDYPGSSAAAQALVNNLDLTLTGPSGTFRGNVFAGGYSTTGGGYDTLNNIENTYIASPPTGVYTVRIDATSIGMGPQNFALVVTANFNDGQGLVQLDRAVYKEADTINIRVEDLNSISPTLNVQLTGSITGDSENATLTVTAPNSGVYTGSFTTGLGITVTDDGTLQVANGETITASYYDNSPIWTSNAYATVDIEGPEISNVRAENIMGTSAIIKWDTNENADSTVYYREFGAGAFLSTNDVNLALAHSVPLTGLTMDTLHEFYVVSTDWQGRTTTDDNAGNYYRFTTTGATSGGALILYVDDDDGALSEGGAGVPFEQDWFNMFNQYGWTYSNWEVVTLGNPTFQDLNQAPMIIWSSAEGYPQLGTDDRAALGLYLDQLTAGGGPSPPMAWLVGQDIGWDMNPGGTDVDQAWYQNYLAATYRGDDADGGGGTEGGAFQVIQAAPNHALNSVYNLNNIDLEQDAFNAGGGRFWPDDVSVRPGGEIAMDYSSHAYGGDSSIIVQQSGGAANAARIVYNAYAHEMIASTNNGPVDWSPPAVDPERGQMLDQTIQWLLGGNHPTVNFVPAGGPSGTYLGNSITIDWTVSGATSVDLYYSPNSGAESILLQSFGGGSPGTYVWDTTGLQDATTYRVKLVALGSATYATLSDVDESLDFEINHGVDNTPPITVPGSVAVDLNPLNVGSPLVLTATIDDSMTGNSFITAAEWMEGANATWPGTPMTASDGLFNQVTEGVTVNIPGSTTSSWAVDVWHTLWVRGQDAAGNWAGSYSTDVYVVGIPSQITSDDADLTGMSIGDWVFVSWNVTATGLITDVINDAAWGDGQSDWDVAQWYDPNDANGDYWKTYNKGYAGTQEMPSVSNAMGFWLRLSANGGDFTMTMGAGAAPVPQGISLAAGWNLVGYPSDTPQQAQLTLPAEVTNMAIYNTGGYNILEVPLSTVMTRGNAYWVYTPVVTTWNIS